MQNTPLGFTLLLFKVSTLRGIVRKPITIVFYGDHLPGIYKNKMLKDGLKLHETDYFIYSNTYAREHGAIDLQNKKMLFLQAIL